MGAACVPPSLPTTVTWIVVPNGKPPSAGSARHTTSKPFDGRLVASSRLFSFGKPGANGITGGAPPPGTNAPASITVTVFGVTEFAAIDSLKRTMTSGLVGPKMTARTSAIEPVPGAGGGGGAPAPTFEAPFTGTVVTIVGAIVSVAPTVNEWNAGAWSSESPSMLFKPL